MDKQNPNQVTKSSEKCLVTSTTVNVDSNMSNPTSPSTNSDTIESPSCLVSTPSIHINHMYVYNFSPKRSANSSNYDTPNKTAKYQSPAASSGPICRICHEGDAKEDLVSPCRCTGSVGLVHKTCMERWLSTRCHVNDKCEICHYTFVTARQPKSLLEWFRSDENNGYHRRSLMGDITCFLLLTPLAIVSSFLCVEGAQRQVAWGNSLEAGCLMALATFLVTIYFVWNIFTARYHFRCYIRWRKRNQHVKLLRVQRISTATDTSSQGPRPIRSSGSMRSSDISITMPDRGHLTSSSYPVFASY